MRSINVALKVLCVLYMAAGTLSGAAVDTLSDNRFLDFDDYTQTNAPAVIWRHEGLMPGSGAQVNRALLAGTNHYHVAGWRLLACRAGSAAYIGFSIPPKLPAATPVYPAVASNLAANLRYESGALIESPVVTNGIGTIYFEAINNQAAYPGQITVEIATNMVDVGTSLLIPTVNPPSTNNLEYVWEALSVVDLSAASSNEFARYCQALNFRGPIKMRIRRTGELNLSVVNPDSAFIVVDNIRLSFPPSDVAVSISETPFEPGYPSVGTNLSVRCRVDNADTNVPTDFRALKVVHRWRFLDQQVQPWQTNAMSLVVGTGDGLGNGEVYQAALAPFSEEGDLEYFFICDFDGPVYESPDYTGTGLGYPYPPEGLSTRQFRPGAEGAFCSRLRPFASRYGQVVVETDVAGQPVAMSLVGEDTWRAMVPVGGSGFTNLTWRFKALGRYVQDSGAFSTGATYWAGSGGDAGKAVPCAGTCVETNAGEALSARFFGGNYIMLTLNTETRGYSATRGEYQDFNYWAAPPTLFTDGNGLDPKNIDLETFDAWPTSQSHYHLQAFAGYPATTNVFSYASFLTLSPECMAGSAAYVSERTLSDNTENAPAGAYKFRNVALRLMGGNGALGLGYLHNRSATLPDGLQEVTFKARLAQTPDNYDICYYRNGFTNLNYLVRATARAATALMMSPQNPSISLVGYYSDPENFYEYRLVQISDPRDVSGAIYDRRVRHELFKWRNGVPALLASLEQTTSYSPLSGQMIIDSVPLELAFFNETTSVTRIRCRYAGVDRLNVVDSSAPLAAGTFGYLSSECLSGLSNVRLQATVAGAIGTNAESVVLRQSGVGDFWSDVVAWYLPSALYQARSDIVPFGIYSIVPTQQVGVYVQPTLYGSEGEPVGPGGSDWQLLKTVAVSNFAYQAVTVAVNSWQSQFVMLQVLGGASDVVVDEFGVASWHGGVNGAGLVDDAEWVASESWVVANAGSETNTVYLDHSRGDPGQDQAVRSPLLGRGMGSMEFDYRVLRGPALLRVQYALERAPSEWVDLKSFATNAATGWLHATVSLGQDEPGFFRVLNVRAGAYTNALVEINNASAADEPMVSETTWRVYNAKITNTDASRVPLDESKMCALNNSQTFETSPVQDQSEPFVQAPVLPGGLGEITFRARAYSNDQPATVYVFATTNGWGAASNQWFELTRFENISNTLYHTFCYKPFGLTGANIDAVRLMNKTGSGARRVCLDDIALSEPLLAGFDIANVRVLCSESGGAYSTNRFLPSASDDVGVEAEITNLRLAPSNIQMYVTYFVGTNIWGADNWPNEQTVTKPLFQSGENPFLYRTSEADDIPAQGAGQVVQYRVWASYWGGVALIRCQDVFERQPEYGPVDLNQIYAGLGWSPYYVVCECQTATETTPVSVPYAWLNLYPSLVETRGGDYEAAAWLDFDGDGLQSWEEYVAGTVPTNRDSVFRALIAVSNSAPRIGWAPDLSPARTYTVEGCATLTDAAWGPTNAESRFFRVKVKLP